jgi:surfactin synthase thioesterase subunit
MNSVVLLHGAGANARILAGVVAGLPGVDVHALSYPGRLEEPGPPLRDIESLVAWTHHRIEGLGLHSVVLVGHSLGTAVAAGVAWLLTRQARTRVHAVLMASTPTRAPGVKVTADLWRAAVLKGEVAWLRALGFLPGTDAELVRGCHAVEELTPLSTVSADWDVAASIGDRTPPALACPWVFVSGAQDKMSHAVDLHAWAARLPHATVELVEGAGHRMDVTHAALLAQRIVALG